MTKILAKPHPPPELREDEEDLIEAVVRWAAAEYRLHGHLPNFPARISTIAGDVGLRCERRATEDDGESDASVLRFRNIELT
jgi:hypothetical protein